MRSGATDAEVEMDLPGDELLGGSDLAGTRAISIGARPGEVWPWIAQLGQGRGGFYSYDFLENLIGCDIHSAEDIVPEWQQVEVGSQLRLHPDIPLTVSIVEPGRALVLRGGVPIGKTAPPYDFTWAFVVRGDVDGSTRLVVRERYRYLRRWAPFVVEPTQLVSFVMSRGMLRGIRRRAERTAHDVDEARRHPGVMRAWIIAWIGGAGIGVANGVARELTYGKRLSEPAASRLSALSAVTAFAGYFRVLNQRWPLGDRRDSLRVGCVWLALTVCFECVLGRLLARKSWREIGAEYDLAKGRLWPLVLAWIALGPEVMRRAARPRHDRFRN
jgi:hypothetical protein